MEYWRCLGFVMITLNCNVTIVGKIWFTSMIILRTTVIVLAGYPLYQDEQERFVCNTLQPGCSNVCYDIFSPVSHFRFWLAQLLCVLLPIALFEVYVLSEAAAQHLTSGISASKMDSSPLTASHVTSKMETWEVPDFSVAYLVQLLVRILAEAGFSAGQYYLFGFSVPKTFSCFESPCTGSIACYISRPTEKSLMMVFMWLVSGGSLLLSVVDLICVILKRVNLGSKRRKLLMVEGDFGKDGHCSNILAQAPCPESPVHGKNNPQPSQYHGVRRKKDDPTHAYSPSFRSDEDETMSLEFGGSAKDTARSNINSNSNKNAYSLQVSFTPTGGSMNALCMADKPSVLTNRQPRFRKDTFCKTGENRSSVSPLYDTKYSRHVSLEDITPSMNLNSTTSAHITSQISEWV
ncbi:gap junction delta-4 protein [Ambystoma mexicanum]|uniref:gap junction delta-4 protein n=1 Tax=Ambystoma mexicanum TaxID=8296 RepID=UPI0037E87532